MNMASTKPISLEAFKNNLKTYYSESGEINPDIDARIDTLAISAIRQNEDNNPLFLTELLNVIKVQEIKLEELVTKNRSNKIRRVNKINSIY